MKPSTYDEKVAELRAYAAASHAQYPQYDGYFDTWVLGLMVRDWEGSGSSVLPAMTIVLLNPVPSITTRGETPHYGVFCIDSNSVCAVTPNDVCLVPLTYYEPSQT